MKNAPRRFVLAAMRILEIDEKTAAGAIQFVLDERRGPPSSETAEKPPADNG
ncbi:MAG TPA: hypothetical protein VNU68_06185 [Verrucomicrobiae bacterium]|nr:hypothetical protein [Verrucomicrobiae bacterium]